MAQDTVAFIETVVGEPAHFSRVQRRDTVALLAALRRPDLSDAEKAERMRTSQELPATYHVEVPPSESPDRQ